MKITIKADFQTDGDYCIEDYNYVSKIVREDIDINLPDRKFKVFQNGYNTYPFEDEYHFEMCFECEDEDYCKIYARNYLEELLCNIRFLSTHYYIMPYFYDMFDKGIRSIGKENHYFGSVSGNYDGTYLEIITIKE